jgi:DNA-binding transcriptional ArsR family regulator
MTKPDSDAKLALSWAFLVPATAPIKDGTRLSHGAITRIAEQLEIALAATEPDRLKAAQISLTAALDEAIKQAPEQAAKVARGEPSAADVTAAHSLGSLEFAQQFATLAASRRVSSEFMDAITDPKVQEVMSALEHGQKSNCALADELSYTEETISRKLRPLERLGIVDWRREGTLRKNFLTPAAQEMMTAKRVAMSQRSSLFGTPIKDPWINEIKRGLPAQNTHFPIFDTTTPLESKDFLKSRIAGAGH